MNIPSLFTFIALTLLPAITCASYAPWQQDPLVALNQLLALGVDPNIKLNQQGGTVLHYFAATGSEKAVEILLAAKADAGALYDGETPYDLAKKNNNDAIMELLSKKMGAINP